MTPYDTAKVFSKKVSFSIFSADFFKQGDKNKNGFLKKLKAIFKAEKVLISKSL